MLKTSSLTNLTPPVSMRKKLFVKAILNADTVAAAIAAAIAAAL